MRKSWRRALCLLSLPLLAAGCFQQAGESLQSLGPTSAPIQQNNPNPTDQLAVTIENPQATPTSESLEFATLSPTQDGSVQQTGPETATVLPITIIVPTSTTLSQDTATPLSLITPQSSQESQVQFITPGSPLGPNITVSTSTPIGGAPISTPSGLITPTALGSSSTTTNLDSVPTECIYTVRPGDTVYRIAIAHDTTVAKMQAANKDLTGDNPIIHPGDELVIPDCEAGTSGGAATVTPVPPIISPAGQATSVGPSQGGQVYTVQPGDTLFVIAQHFGVTVKAIVEANNISDPNRLALGQELVIPPPSP